MVQCVFASYMGILHYMSLDVMSFVFLFQCFKMFQLTNIE